MKFGKLAEMSAAGLVVTPAHERWVREHPEIEVSPSAMSFLVEQLSGTPRKREGTFSASSLGSCLRAQQFTFHGVPQAPIDSKTAAIFHNGTFVHLRWQVEGLTAGWLSVAEVPLPENPHRLSGTMDGTIGDDGVLEVKSANDRSFASMLAFGPTSKYMLQGAAYLLATGRRYVSYLIENKNTQEYVEKVLTADELPLGEAKLRVDGLWAAEQERRLLPVMDGIYEAKGECRWCPFKNVCLGYQSYADLPGEE